MSLPLLPPAKSGPTTGKMDSMQLARGAKFNNENRNNRQILHRLFDGLFAHRQHVDIRNNLAIWTS